MNPEEFYNFHEQVQVNYLAELFDTAGDAGVLHFAEKVICKNKINTAYHLVLGSNSLRRQYIFKEIYGLDFTIKKPAANECLPEKYQSFQTITKAVALIKLLSLVKQGDLGEVTVCSDTLCFKDGEILGQPQGLNQDEKLNDAKRLLFQVLPGSKQYVSSSVAVYCIVSNKILLIEDTAEIKFQKMSPAMHQLYAYYLVLPFLKGRGPIGKAGAYGIQEPEILATIEYIKGDPFTLIALPVYKTKDLLEKSGIKIKAFSQAQLFESVWGKSQWQDRSVSKLLKEKYLDYDFTKLAQEKII